MKLNTAERILLLPLVPVEGNLLEAAIARRLRNQIEFNENEQTKLNLRLEPVPGNESLGRYKWDEEKDFEKRIRIGDKGKELIKKNVKKLSKQEKISIMMLPTLEKFNFIPEDLKKEFEEALVEPEENND